MARGVRYCCGIYMTWQINRSVHPREQWRFRWLSDASGRSEVIIGHHGDDSESTTSLRVKYKDCNYTTWRCEACEVRNKDRQQATTRNLNTWCEYIIIGTRTVTRSRLTLNSSGQASGSLSTEFEKFDENLANKNCQPKDEVVLRGEIGWVVGYCERETLATLGRFASSIFFTIELESGVSSGCLRQKLWGQ